MWRSVGYWLGKFVEVVLFDFSTIVLAVVEEKFGVGPLFPNGKKLFKLNPVLALYGELADFC
jgi:hypothetical protein